MVKRVQLRFWLIAMAAMGFCVIALVAVINLLNAAQADREITRALAEMVETVESVQAAETAAVEEEPEWRVESYVEEAPPSETPEASAEPSPEVTAASDPYFTGKDGNPRGMDGWGKKRPWWYEDFLPEYTETGQTESTPTPEPQETIINHYYYYYPAETDSELDLRNSAMNQYAGRLCVVSFSEGSPPVVGMSDSNALTEPEAITLAEQMIASGTAGDLDSYRYQVKTNPDGTWVYFLDCSTEHQAVRSLLMVSILVGLGGLLVMGLFVYFMSRKAMAPLRESVERQKRFITDAGHELKTPLAVIGTNMDILEMDIGKNEWVDGTKKQLSRLRKLVANLISLSRLEEMQEKLELEPFDLSGAAAECVDAFSGPAELAGKTLSAELEDHLTALGDVMTAGQLLTILCDNAVKYSTGDIQVRLYASGRRVIFETENDWDHRLPPEELSKLFDRFYRGDASRSGEGGKTGYGLGLSIAKAIAEKNHAQLTAEENELGHILFRASFRRDRS